MESAAADLVATVRALEAKVVALEDEVKTLRAGQSDAPMSKSEVARRLRVSKSRTLLPAIAQGKVRTVTVGKEQRISVSEFVRLREEGFGQTKRQKRAAARAPAPVSRVPDTAAAIAMLDQMEY